MNKIIAIAFIIASTYCWAQPKSPSEFLGYEIGTEFSRHADVVNYFEHVAANSEMVLFNPYGKTNERRPLTYAVVSSAANIENIDAIRRDNLKNIGIENGTAAPDTAIVWLSYNVHGNEASSMEAAMQTIYDLITKKQSWLENTVVIIDPCINPDGRDRYANWYNQVKASPYNKKQVAVEHNEPWPGGRPNHYLFDLNRDWAWATQVETRERLKIYNQWMPHVHVDFHEQGINEPYYFAPAAEPYHEVITEWQRDFQTEIGKNHARYFDKEGWLFFTRERFDLLYPSYGDTYPTFMGAIGMTYEQAGHGRAGLGVMTDEGYVLTLKDRVAHHNTTGLSTVEVASKNAVKLNREFKKFFQNGNLKYKSYVLKGDPDKLDAVAELLKKHEIRYGYSSGGTVSGYHYLKRTTASMNTMGAMVVPTDQPKGKMIKVLFEPEAELSDPLTYDITAWSVPYAYGLETVAVTSKVPANMELPTWNIRNSVDDQAPGYILEWSSMYDAKFLTALLKAGIKVRFSEKDLSFGGDTFMKGSLVITRSDNRNNDQFDTTVNSLADDYNRQLYPTATSFSDNGTDFGSPDIKLVNPQEIAVLTGKGTSSLSYGALWHFFEKQLKYPITSINTDDFDPDALDQFDVLIMPSGWYNRVLNESGRDKLKDWIRNGGKVIAIGNALRSFAGKDGFGLERNDNGDSGEDDSNVNLTPYDQRQMQNVTNYITGSIYEVNIDPTHPMAFGYDDTYYSLKMGSNSYSFLKEGYNVGFIKGEAKSISGFSGEQARSKLKNSLVFGEKRIGRGSIVYMVDDVMFRSFWENGKLFLVNSIFFVNNNKYRL